MLTIEIELLAGRYAATSQHDRRRAEWPPHPARLFSALVAALHDGGGEDHAERDALIWLEKQAPPSLRVDPIENVSFRNVLDYFVPVNDVTTVGDAERPVREAREALATLDSSNASAAEKKAATRRLERELKKLELFAKAQQIPERSPSDVAVKAAGALLPPRTARQVRTFPVVIPHNAVVEFSWDIDLPPSLAAPLDRLTRRVTRLGHSSSLVRCAISDKKPEPTLIPYDDGDGPVLRVVGPGQLERLEAEFARHRAVEPRVLPFLPKQYGAPGVSRSSETVEPVFSREWIVFERVGGARLLSSKGIDLARAFRKALIEKHGSETLPIELSGHDAAGPANVPHVAFVPLPFVGPEHSDSSIQGLAMILPRSTGAAQRTALLRLVAKLEQESVPRSATAASRDEADLIELAGTSLPPILLRRSTFPSKHSLNANVWCRPSRSFATVTPIALDRNPGNLRSNFERTAHKAAAQAEEFIAEACVNIGLPRPEEVQLSFAPLVRGAQHTRDFKPYPGQRGRTPRVRVHALLRFAEDVRGPVILGAGRFFGLGLCLPLREDR